MLTRIGDFFARIPPMLCQYKCLEAVLDHESRTITCGIPFSMVF